MQGIVPIIIDIKKRFPAHASLPLRRGVFRLQISIYFQRTMDHYTLITELSINHGLPRQPFASIQMRMQINVLGHHVHTLPAPHNSQEDPAISSRRSR